MPFNVKELVPMAQALRDACVGIIELAHPDTKPLLREDYMKAFHSVGVQHNTLSLNELQQQRDTWAYLFKVCNVKFTHNSVIICYKKVLTLLQM